MTTYDAHVGDSGTTITKTLTVAGTALGNLTGATISVRATNPSGVVETWSSGFTPGTLGSLSFVTPNTGYWDEVGTWRWDVQYVLGGVTQTCDPIFLEVGPSGTAPGSLTLSAAGVVSLYIDPTSGSDTNDGSSSTNAVQTWARLEALLPLYYTTSCTITIVGTTAITIADGLHQLPTATGTASPINIVGSYAQWAAGGGSGTRTIAAAGVGTNTITDNAGGLTADGYVGFRLRFTSGDANGEYYTVQTNTATVITLAHAFENGSTPSAGDTFVLEQAAGRLEFNDLQWYSPSPVVMDGVLLVGVGAGSTRQGAPAAHLLTFMGGPWYVPNCAINSQNGRTWIDRGSLRTYDVIEGYLVDPYPSLIGGYYGFYMATGDLSPNAGCDIMGCLIARNIDFTLRQGSVVDLVNMDLKVLNQHDHYDGSFGRYTATTGNSARAWAGTGNVFHFAHGSKGWIDTVDVSSSASNAAYLEMGGELTATNFTGTGNGAYGIVILSGAVLHSVSGNTVTGASGDLIINSVAKTWADVATWGGETRPWTQ